MKTNKKPSLQKDKKISGIGIRLFLNSDTNKLTIQSVINGSTAEAADIKPNDVIIKIDEKLTKAMSVKEAVSLIKGPKVKPITLVLLRVNDAGKKKKINVRLVRNIFIIPNKNYLYECNIKRELEFYLTDNIKKIFPENNFSPKLKEGNST